MMGMEVISKITPDKRKEGKKPEMMASSAARYWLLVTVEIKRPWPRAVKRKKEPISMKTRKLPSKGTW
jgi:hypothetical protein